MTSLDTLAQQVRAEQAEIDKLNRRIKNLLRDRNTKVAEMCTMARDPQVAALTGMTSPTVRAIRNAAGVKSPSARD